MAKNVQSMTVPLIVLFLASIYTLPVVQAVVEIQRGRSIQVLDLFSDALVTPYVNANRLDSLAVRVAAGVDSVSAKLGAAPADSSSAYDAAAAEQVVDDGLVSVAEMRRTAHNINRHVRADTTAPAFWRLDSLNAALSALMQELRDQTPAAQLSAPLAALRARSAELVKEYPHKSMADVPLLALANLRFILWNDKYLRPYEKEMENSSVFALAVRPPMQFFQYMAFHDLGEKGVLGRNGWFYYKSDVDYVVRPYVRDPRAIVVDPNDKPMTDNPIAAAKRFKQQLDSMGIDLLMVIVPGKPSIYPDALAKGIRPEAAGTISPSLHALKDLREAGVEVVDLFGPLAHERLHDAEAGDSIYLQKDTHWKARGLMVAAKTVAERIKQYPWYQPGSTEYAMDSVVVERNGDVGVMTTLPAFRVRELAMGFAAEKTKCFQVYTVSRDANGNEAERTLYKDDFKNSQVLLLGDSFSRIYQTDEPRSAGWIAHLARELSQPIASVVNDGGASTLVRESLARRPNLLRGKKLVVWEIVERDLRYGAEGWKNVEIALK